MADLKTNFKNDVLNTDVNPNRKYQMTTNSDGTVSFTDVTNYSQVGDSFGAEEINTTNGAINQINSDLSAKLGSNNFIYEDSQRINISSAVYQKLLESNELPSGIYIISRTIDYTKNSNGMRGIYNENNTSGALFRQQAVTDSNTTMRSVTIDIATSPKKYSLYAFQNSGSSLQDTYCAMSIYQLKKF